MGAGLPATMRRRPPIDGRSRKKHSRPGTGGFDLPQGAFPRRRPLQDVNRHWKGLHGRHGISAIVLGSET